MQSHVEQPQRGRARGTASLSCGLRLVFEAARLVFEAACTAAQPALEAQLALPEQEASILLSMLRLQSCVVAIDLARRCLNSV